ncbi:DUF624 domain-containing protein [Alkalibacterium sp. f15]|uniref:DUF624 domain-containing protein n=1 Tax=Alkalibacterium sp. f15 TaxID=3414029 RepID=UPI003BF7F12F
MGEKIYLMLYELSVLILKFTLVNILWIIVELPVIIVLIQIGLTTEPSNLLVLLPLLSLFLPILFFPGTHALISSVRELILEDAPFNPLTFFKDYKKGYKKSFLIGMIYTSLLTMGGYVFFITYQSNLILSIILIVLFFYLSIVVFYLFYLDAHFNMSIRWKVKQTTVLIIKHPLFALGNFMIFIALHYILYSVNFILFVLFGTTLTVYATYYLFIRKLNKINARIS